MTGVADIDSQGKVEHVDLLPVEDKGGKELVAQLAPLAKSTMSQWEFIPATENGQPTAAHTFLHGVFEFRAQGDKYEARFVFTGNGPRLDEKAAPQYPSSMVTARIQAKLVMLMLVQPDGSLSDIQLESAQTTGRKSAHDFVRAAKAAAKSWRAEPEMIDGHPVKTWIRIPISFDLRDAVNRRQYAPALDSPIKMRPQSP